jgi:D-tyrosyl-tRNA(Tyr) deacylase
MRAVLQRVTSACVLVDQKTIGEIQQGLVVLIGVGKDDDTNDVKYLAEKILNLRIFNDSQHKMNYSLFDINGELLIISQFTLYGDCRKGRRPSYDTSAPPEIAYGLYEEFVATVKSYGLKVETGKFQAHMDVSLTNDGPVTLLLDSKKVF